MKHKLTSSSLLLLALSLTLSQSAAAISLWYVDGVHGSDQNNCRSLVTACKTIGHAIALASSGDSIFVAAAIYSEHPSLAFNLSIVGSAAQTTIIDGGRTNTVVTISPGAHVTLLNLTIRNGYNGSGGGIWNRGILSITNNIVSGNRAYFGGGVDNSGTMTITNSTVTGNQSIGYTYSWGGGVVNYGNLTIIDSTVSGNQTYTSGGGIRNWSGAMLTITNSTFSGNGAGFYLSQQGYGGGIFNDGTVSINNSTISWNGALRSGGDIYTAGGTVTIRNSIVANSPSGGNCSGSITSNGYNLSSDGTCGFNQTGDLNNADPLLGPLQYNGGPTQTMALQSGSPAIDTGNPSGCTDGSGHLLTTDQRGMPRPDREDTGGCDMGAYERQTD